MKTPKIIERLPLYAENGMPNMLYSIIFCLLGLLVVFFRNNRKLKATRDRQKERIRLFQDARDARGKDFHLNLLMRSATDTGQLIDLLRANGKTSFDLVLAHELQQAGLAGLRAAHEFDSEFKLLDVVEYPDLAGRSSKFFSDMAIRDSIGNALNQSSLTEISSAYDHVITTSNGQLEALKMMGVDTPKTLIRNMRYHQSVMQNRKIREDTNCKANEILLLYCNNVYLHFGARECIAALEKLPSCYRLAFLGEIQDGVGNLSEIAASYGVSERVSFLEPVRPAELVEYSSGADLALIPLMPSIPNNVHSLPNRIYESIAASNPVIAPRMIETGKFVLEHDIGLVFEDFSPTEIARVVVAAAAKLKAGEFDAQLRLAARTLTWEQEREPLVELLDSTKGTTALVIALKSIERNDRIFRLTRELVCKGFETTVVCKSLPLRELRVEGADYFRLDNINF